MVYSNAWDDTHPPGSELAKNIDEAIRRLRLDIHERMDDVVADWTADPVQLGSLAAAIAKAKYIDYNNNNSAGNKVVSATDLRAMLTLKITATTSASGLFTVDLDEINAETSENWQISDYVSFHWSRLSGAADQVTLIGTSTLTNIIEFLVEDFEGTTKTNTAITGLLTLFFQTNVP